MRLFHYSHDSGIVCQVCYRTIDGNAETLVSHIDRQHRRLGIQLRKAEASHFVSKISNLSNGGPKKEKKAYHCYQYGRIALKRNNLNKLHSNSEETGCVKWDIAECVALEDSLGRLTLHSSPSMSFFQSQIPLWLPDIYGTKAEVTKSVNVNKPQFRERLRNKIKALRLCAECYRTRVIKTGLFEKNQRRYLPYSFYNKVRNGTYSNDAPYVYGSLFCPSVGDTNALPAPDLTAPKIIDMTDKQELELKIHLGDGKFTIVKIVNASCRTELVNAVVRLGNDAAANTNFEKGHVRKMRDLGRMFRFGYNWKNNDFYPTCRGLDTQGIIKEVAGHVTELLLDHFRSDLLEILSAENEEGRHPIDIMRLLGSKIMLSVDLVNSCHLDIFDKSRSVAIWTESIPGSTENWYFILPYVSFRGSCGVAIKLFHGCSISWDARVLYHCSTFTNNSQHGHAYGCMFGSCAGSAGSQSE